MKRIIRHEGPKATDYALALKAWREKYSHVDFATLSDEESKAAHDEMPITDFHLSARAFGFDSRPRHHQFVSELPIQGIPIGVELKGQSIVVIGDNILGELFSSDRTREYHTKDDGAQMTKREGERDIEMIKSDPPPSHILLAKNGGRRVIASFVLSHR
jgi:hypothetical protein